jgi:hypothetical protein
MDEHELTTTLRALDGPMEPPASLREDLWAALVEELRKEPTRRIERVGQLERDVRPIPLSGRPYRRSRVPRPLLGVLALGLALLIGLLSWWVGWIGDSEMVTDDPTPTIVPQTSTTVPATPTTAVTTLPPIVEGEALLGAPLVLRESRDVGVMEPVAVVEHDGNLVLLGKAAWDADSLLAWVSGDGGITWEAAGTVIADSVGEVVSTPQGLIAFGIDRPEGAPRIWRSQDGLRWSPTDLPAVGHDGPGWYTWFTAAAATDDLLVVFGKASFDAWRVIADAVRSHLGLEEGEPLHGLHWEGPPLVAHIQQPPGIAVFSATAADLGLTAEEEAFILGSGSLPPVTAVWASRDGGTSWEVTEVEASSIYDAWPTPAGDVMALVSHGDFFGSPEVWVSADGIEWERRSLPIAYPVSPWDGGLISVVHLGGRPDIVHSSEGERVSFGISRLFPEGPYEWHFTATAVGPAGLVTVAHGWSGSSGAAGPERVSLEKDGYVLTLDDSMGLAVLSTGDTEVLRIPLWEDRVAEEVVADLGARTMTFLHPVTGEPLVTFTFDELDEASSAMWPHDEDIFRQVMLFSTDGVVWSLEELPEADGRHGAVSILHVASDRVIAVVTRYPVRAPGYRAPSVDVWLALIP